MTRFSHPFPSARLGRLGAALLGTSALVAACSTGNSPDTQGTSTGAEGASLTPVTIGLTYTPDVQFAPFYLAETSGAFERAGLDVTLRHHGASESLFGALTSGEEDVVFAGGDEMMQARSQGVDVVNFATLYQDYPVALIVPEDSGITGAEHLTDATIGIPGPYGETYFGLLALAQEAGLSVDDLHVQHIGYTQQSALQSQAVDAIMGFTNNDAVQLEAAGLAVRSIPIDEEGQPSLVSTGLGASSQMISEDPETLSAIVTALRETMAGPGQDPQEVLDAAGEHIPGMVDAANRERARATWEATLPLYGPAEQIGAVDVPLWEEMSGFMAETGLVDEQVPAEEAVTSQIISLTDQ